MRVHESSRPVDRIGRLLVLARTFRAWGEDWTSLGRILTDPGFRELGEQHIALGECMYGMARQGDDCGDLVYVISIPSGAPASDREARS